MKFYGECKEHLVRLELDEDSGEAPFSETIKGSNVWEPDFSFMSCPEFIRELEATEPNDSLDRFEARMQWIDDHTCNDKWVMMMEGE